MHRRAPAVFGRCFERDPALAQQRGVAHQHDATFDGCPHTPALQLVEGLWLGHGDALSAGCVHNRLGQRVCRSPVGGSSKSQQRLLVNGGGA